MPAKAGRHMELILDKISRSQIQRNIQAGQYTKCVFVLSFDCTDKEVFMDTFSIRDLREALGRLAQADTGAVTALLTAAKDANSHVRQVAVQALGGLGQADTSIATALVTAIQDKEVSVRQAAIKSLGKLSQLSSMQNSLTTALTRLTLITFQPISSSNTAVSIQAAQKGKIDSRLQQTHEKLIQPDKKVANKAENLTRENEQKPEQPDYQRLFGHK